MSRSNRAGAKNLLTRVGVQERRKDSERDHDEAQCVSIRVFEQSRE
jgi:hypothetical protein